MEESRRGKISRGEVGRVAKGRRARASELSPKAPHDRRKCSGSVVRKQGRMQCTPGRSCNHHNPWIGHPQNFPVATGGNGADRDEPHGPNASRVPPQWRDLHVPRSRDPSGPPQTLAWVATVSGRQRLSFSDGWPRVCCGHGSPTTSLRLRITRKKFNGITPPGVPLCLEYASWATSTRFPGVETQFR